MRSETHPLVGYFKTLSGHGKDRYKAKLEAVSFSLNNDPYMTGGSDKWHSDITCWPKIEYTHPTHLCLLNFKTWDIYSGAVALVEAARSL